MKESSYEHTHAQFAYQFVDCSDTLLKIKFNGSVYTKKFNIMERAVHLNQRVKELERMPNFAKQIHLRKNFRKYMSSTSKR